MFLPLLAALLLCLPTLVLALVLWGVAAVRRRVAAGFWKRVLWAHVVLSLFHAFVTFPAALGFIGSRMIDTRPDERAYAGPRIADDGEWLVQDRSSLRRESKPGVSVESEIVTAARRRELRIESTGGVTLRAFLVEARQSPPRATVLMVHGLFRNAMELETVGAMFRRLGCEVLLLELRNHGGSDRAVATFGLREADDVVAGVEWLQARPDRAAAPLVLYGVSLGTAAVARAAPRINELAGVVLDAPMDDLLATAHRMHGRTRNGGRRVLELWQPWRSMVLRSVELWSGFSMTDVRPALSLQSLPASVAVFLIGGSEDDRMPPDVVQRMYDGLPMREGVKQLWIREDAGHGKVWEVAPVEYEKRIAEWLRQV